MKTKSAKTQQLYVVMECHNGWDGAPGEKTTFFTDKKEATKLLREMVKEANEEGVCDQTKIFMAKVEVGKTFQFCGYGDFDGGTMIKEVDVDDSKSY